MKKNLKTIGLTYFSLAVIGMAIINIWLPNPSFSDLLQNFFSTILFYLFETFFILLGPLSAPLLLVPYYSGFTIGVLLLLGILSGIGQIYFLRKKQFPKLVVSPLIVVWIAVGSISSFWGMASAV